MNLIVTLVHAALVIATGAACAAVLALALSIPMLAEPTRKALNQ